MHRVGNSRKGLPGWIRAEPKAICNALGTAQSSESDHGGSSWGKVTHTGARDEVREFSHSPMQNSLLNTLHIEE